MPTLKIDLATTVLSEKMKVHLVRPGARYAFFNTVEDEGVLPVDVPFLEVEDGEGVPSAPKISSQLERARVLREWAKKPRAKRPQRPSVAIGDYALDLVDPSRAAIRTKLRNAAQSVLWDIPGGTLIVVPSRSLYGDAILATIASRKSPRVVVSGAGANVGLRFPARKLNDLKKIPMRDVPAEVAESARTVRVVEEIAGHAEDRLLRQYFGDYQRAGDHVAGIHAQTEDFDARVLGQMIELHMAMEHTLRTGRPLKPGTALFNLNVAGGPLFHAKVDSPDGRAFLESATPITFAMKLMMIVAASGVAPAKASQAIEQSCLEVENSRSQHNKELIEASKHALIDFTTLSGYECVSDYISALQDGLDRNAASIAGHADLED